MLRLRSGQYTLDNCSRDQGPWMIRSEAPDPGPESKNVTQAGVDPQGRVAVVEDRQAEPSVTPLVR